MGGGEGDPMTTAGSLHGQGDTEMRLARAGRSEEDDVGRLREEVQLGQMGDDLPLHAGLDLEVEVVDRLDRREAGGLDPGLAPMALARADLLGEHRGQIRLVVPALVAGGLGQSG